MGIAIFTKSMGTGRRTVADRARCRYGFVAFLVFFTMGALHYSLHSKLNIKMSSPRLFCILATCEVHGPDFTALAQQAPVLSASASESLSNRDKASFLLSPAKYTLPGQALEYSIELWLKVATAGQLATIVLFGPVALHIKHPAVFTLQQYDSYPFYKKTYSVNKGLRANCGPYALSGGRITESMSDAVGVCSKLEGCRLFTRNYQGATVYCSKALSLMPSDEWCTVKEDQPLTSGYCLVNSARRSIWHHVVVVVSKHTYSLYVDGYRRASLQDSTYTHEQTLLLGISPFQYTLPRIHVKGFRYVASALSISDIQELWGRRTLPRDLLHTTTAGNTTALPYCSSASVIVPFDVSVSFDITEKLKHMMVATGYGCRVRVFFVCYRNLLKVNFSSDWLTSFSNTVHVHCPDKHATWKQSVLSVQHLIPTTYVVLAHSNVAPTYGWLRTMLTNIHVNGSIGAVSAKCVFENGTIHNFGLKFMFTNTQDGDMWYPTFKFAGYPTDYALSLRDGKSEGAPCLFFMTDTYTLFNVMATTAQSHNNFCIDLSYYLKTTGKDVWQSPTSVHLVENVEENDAFNAKLLLDIYKKYNVHQTTNQSSITWVVPCAGHTLLSTVETIESLGSQFVSRVQVARQDFCNFVDFGQSTFVYNRVNRYRRISSILPSKVVIMGRDLSLLSMYLWPPDNVQQHVIARLDWSDMESKAWQMMATHYDCLWVPSVQMKNYVQSKVGQHPPVYVVNNAIDANLFNPGLSSKVFLPRNSRLSLFSVVDSACWGNVVDVFLLVYGHNDTVVLYLYVNGMEVLSTMDAIRSAVGYQNDRIIFLNSLPYVKGLFDVLMLCRSVDAFVLHHSCLGWEVHGKIGIGLGKIVAISGPYRSDFPQLNSNMSLQDQLRTLQPSVPGKAYPEVTIQATRLLAGSQLNITALTTLNASRQSPIGAYGAPSDTQVCASIRPALQATNTVGLSKSFKLAMISTWPPTHCGLAVFACDLARHLISVKPGLEVDVYAIAATTGVEYNNSACGGAQHVYTILQHVFSTYMVAVDYINRNHYDSVVIQHEFGIYGGTFGAFVLCLIRLVSPKVVLVVHVMSDELPDEPRRLLALASFHAHRTVVMSNTSKSMMSANHGIPPSTVHVIPHGVAWGCNLSVVEAKTVLGVTKNILLLSYGLIHPGKGMHLTLQALPDVVQRFPEVKYYIIGELHPTCLHGSSYLQYLRRLTLQLNLTLNVVFHNKFIEETELHIFLQAADMYISVYDREPVISNSGTLSKAMAAGKAIISTPYEHARNVLQERGLLVDFENVEQLKIAIITLITDVPLRESLSAGAAHYARSIHWSAIARQYASIIYPALAGH